ncbi:hypothetical protein [Paenibacillus sp. FSL R5-0345]|uniref:hypothetical protein n=1 Tax=Paenibacillus sp. FSL R5-0345 TaxID=1536770 RepID=UPI001E61FA35|nr:hypothetical protein [Paenibacillus sp. FSL R5-0345]
MKSEQLLINRVSKALSVTHAEGSFAVQIKQKHLYCNLTVRVTVINCLPKNASLGSKVPFRLLRSLLTALTLNAGQKRERAANGILRVVVRTQSTQWMTFQMACGKLNLREIGGTVYVRIDEERNRVDSQDHLRTLWRIHNQV